MTTPTIPTIPTIPGATGPVTPPADGADTNPTTTPETPPEAPPEAPAAAVPAARKWPESIRVKPVFGDMRNPFTQQWIEMGASKKVLVDAWVISQIEGGKLVESDD